MKQWAVIAFGTAGTITTAVTKDVFAVACGVLTFALLARKCLVVFRGDFRAWRARRAQRANQGEKTRESGPIPPT